MAVKQLSDYNTDGTCLGQDANDKIGFYGKTPIVRPSAIVTASAASSATDIVPVLNAVIGRLTALGLN